jgi:hypothetical protein
MTLTAEQCCNTIGCNCAGTTASEMLSNVPIWVFPLIVLGCALILVLIVRRIK